MNIKEIVEGMTAQQVAQVIKDNFESLDISKADKVSTDASITALDISKADKEETDAKLSELGSNVELYYDSTILVDGYYNVLSDKVKDNIISNSTYICGKFFVYKGDIVNIKGLAYTSSGTRFYAITDKNSNVLQLSATADKVDDTINIQDDGYIYVNSYKSQEFSIRITGQDLKKTTYKTNEAITRLEKSTEKSLSEIEILNNTANALTPFCEEVEHTASSNWKSVYNDIPKGFTAIININSISVGGTVLYTTHDSDTSSSKTGKGLMIIDNIKKLSVAANKSSSDWESGISYIIRWDIMIVPSCYLIADKMMITSSQFEEDGNYYGTGDKKWVYHASYNRYKPIFLQKGSILQFRIVVSNNYTSSLFKVGDDGAILESLITADGTSNTTEGTITITEDGLYVFSYVSGSVYIITDKYLSSEYGLIITRKDSQKEDIPSNASLVTNGGELGVFSSIAVCGDSLSSGEMAYGGSTDEGTTKYRDMYEYSWVQFLARKTGFEAFNFSVGGLSAKTFFTSTNSKVREFDTKYCQAYFIALGHNDLNYCKSNYASLGYSSLEEYLPVYIGSASDIDLNNYNNNADSFYGNYAKIIQSIKEKVPNAKIFPIVMKSTYYNAFNVVVKKMAELFDNIYIVDMQKYFPEIPEWHYTEGHGNAMGYKAYGNEVATVVDWIIRNNRNYFKYTSLIGTNLANYIPKIESTSVPSD